jgi:hypothetical protein
VPAFRTLEQFTDLMPNGPDYRADATPILQVMPWPVYGKMSDRELEAIYEYMTTAAGVGRRCSRPV